MLIYVVMGFNVLAVLSGLFATFNSGLVGEFGASWLIYMILATIADGKNKKPSDTPPVPLTELALCPYNFTAPIFGSMFGVWVLGRTRDASAFWIVALYAVPMLLPCFTRIFTMSCELIGHRARASIPAAECQEL